MSVFDWFNARRGTIERRGGPVLEGIPDPNSVPAPREGVFVSKQSLASFAGASGAVTLISEVVARLAPAWGKGDWVVLVVALVVGGLVFLINELDPEKVPKTARDWIISASVAFVNSLVLFNAALGAGSLIK